MRSKEIISGETYLFVATDDPRRQHLAGKPFTVSHEHKPYSREKRYKGRTGYKNIDGEFAWSFELEELPAAPEFVKGLRFFSKRVPGLFEVIAIYENSGMCSVRITNEDEVCIQSGLIISSMKLGFEQGDYWPESELQIKK